MVLRLYGNSANFSLNFASLLAIKREPETDVDTIVKEILQAVAKNGDAALIEFSKKFDKIDLTADQFRFNREEIRRGYERVSADELNALKSAYNRILSFHQRQMPQDNLFVDELGVELGWRWRAIEAVGIYVPGGTASYPSSVLMNAIPAKVAGVKRLVMMVPAPQGEVNPLVLVAADLAGVDEIYRLGGAQAIGALAYGTNTIQKVSKIVGPGNAYVAAAKRQVFGLVGIDMIAGPSEVLILADKDANPEWIAADLLAQAEHDTNAQSILITDCEHLADRVELSLNQQVKLLPRTTIAQSSWDRFGAIVIVEDLVRDAPTLANHLAPEHLEIMTEDPDKISPLIDNAGAIFLGSLTPEAVGDYVGGSNHVLPTTRTARFASGLGVMDFLKRTSLLRCNAKNLRTLAPTAVILGRAEGLEAHAKSLEIRLSYLENQHE